MSNQTKKISLLDLKYTKLRKKIGDIEIYNPDKGLKLEIEKEFIHRITESFGDGNEQINMTICLGEMIAVFIPLLTNIEGLDDVLMVSQILDNPSPLLEKVVDEVSEILSDIFERTIKTILKAQKVMSETLESDSLSLDEKISILSGLEEVSVDEGIKDEDIFVSEKDLVDLDEI